MFDDELPESEDEEDMSLSVKEELLWDTRYIFLLLMERDLLPDMISGSSLASSNSFLMSILVTLSL